MIKSFQYIFKFFIFTFITAICFLFFTFIYYNSSLPEIKKLKNYQPDLVSKIYASNGELLEEYAVEYRLFAPIKEIPSNILHAFLAAEDAEFYNHPGIDGFALGRALIQNIKNLKEKKALIGGSTITQQVVKNLLLTNEKSLERKIKEAILSIRLEGFLTKDEILELYLNHIYLGNRSYGITSAAAKYFNKTLEELNLSEAAMLAALPKAPSYFNPKIYPHRVFERRNWVLKQMYEKNFIYYEDYQQAIKQPIEICHDQKKIFKAGYFSNEVRNIIAKKYGKSSLFIDGLIIQTTIIPRLQAQAQRSFQKGLLEFDKKLKAEKAKNSTSEEADSLIPEVNGAMIVVHNNSGRVVALVGGYDFDQSQFNRATQAVRQSGSVFKPFVYAAALENGFNPSSNIDDMPIAITQGMNQPNWMPKNYADDFLGKITLRRSLELSRNVSTVNLVRELGLKKISKLVRDIGIADYNISNYSAALGATDTKLINVTAGYATIASGGKKIEPILIETIQNRDGKVIFRNPNLSCQNCYNKHSIPQITDHKKRVISEETSFQVINILQGAVKRGTAKKVGVLNMNIAGKTGTTNDNKDVWFIGATPDYTIGIFIGYDFPKSLGKKATGATVAAPIFIDFINSSRWFFKDRVFKTPKNIKMVKINYLTGEKATENTKSAIFEAFKIKEEPFENKDLIENKIDLLLGPEVIY